MSECLSYKTEQTIAIELKKWGYWAYEWERKWSAPSKVHTEVDTKVGKYTYLISSISKHLCSIGTYYSKA